MLVADIAEARWRGLMRQLTEARGETSTALAERAGLDRPRWSYVTVGDRLPADVTERRALLTRVLDALEAPPSVRIELELLAGTTAILPAAVQVVAVTDAHELPASPPPISRVRTLAVDPADWPDPGVSRVIPDAGLLGTALLVEVDAHPPRALVLLDDLLAVDCHCCSDGMPDLTCHWLPLSALEGAP